MHEMSLISSLITLVKQESVKKNFKTVKNIWLKVGELSCVEDEALCFCFNALASKESLLANTTLHIEKEQGQATCLACNKIQEIARFGQPCAYCGGKDLKILTGQDVYIDKISVEE